MTDIKGTSNDLRDLLARGAALGWQYRRRSTSHILAIWPPTGESLILPSSASDWRSLKNSESDMARISGPLRSKPGNGKSVAERAEARRRDIARQSNTTRRRMAYKPEPRRTTPPPQTAMEAAFMDYLDRIEAKPDPEEGDTHDRNRSAG